MGRAWTWILANRKKVAAALVVVAGLIAGQYGLLDALLKLIGSLRP